MTLMRAPRRPKAIRRTLGALGLAYALVFQIFVGGYLGALKAAPAAAGGLAAICSAKDSPASGRHDPAHPHDGADPCCMLGCAASGALAPPTNRAAAAAAHPVARTAYRTYEAPPVSGRPNAGPLGARAPPGIA